MCTYITSTSVATAIASCETAPACLRQPCNSIATENVVLTIVLAANCTCQLCNSSNKHFHNSQQQGSSNRAAATTNITALFDLNATANTSFQQPKLALQQEMPWLQLQMLA
jgi:hypothetical protein